MTRFAAIVTVLVLVMGKGAAASVLESSPRPHLRSSIVKPGVMPGIPRMLPVFGPASDTVRPRLRADRAGATPQRMTRPGQSAGLIARSLIPRPRPRRTVRTAVAVRSQPSTVVTGRSGALCGDRSIRGETLAPIPGRLRGCGVARPVRVASVDGVALDGPSVMDCSAAKALKKWLGRGVKPAIGQLGGGVKSLTVIDSYSCRTRNNQPGAKISEHGRGRAVDIAAINLNNGLSLNVDKDWDTRAKGKLLHRIHDSACGPFGTVLGPGSDRFHDDHIHVDTARHRGGAYCR